MCGFVAVHSPDAPIRPDVVSRGVAALAHRGPDGRGEWRSADGHAVLGHARLILVDPHASQPIASEDGRLQIVVNGEFYDDERLRRELLRGGHVLRTRSDSEIALHLYEDLGPACLHELRGEFAFAIWNERRKVLFAARDRFGVKPLFYAQIGRVTYLASEVRALLAMGVPAVWDREAVYQTMNFCLDASRTLFSGIRQVPPAHALTATVDGVRIERYWDVPYPRRDAIDPGLTPEACVTEVRRLIDEAVRVRMRGDAPVGCLLSSGLDSSAVFGLMAQHAEHPVATFTVGFDDPSGGDRGGYDESALALATASRLGAHAHVLRLTDRDLADHFAAAVGCGETVQLNAHGVARFLLSRHVHRSGYRAVLGGEGADELFAGYAFLPRSSPGVGWTTRLSSWLPRWLSGALRLMRPTGSAHARIAQTSPWLSRAARLIGIPAPAVESLAERLDLTRGVLTADLLAEMRDFDPCDRLYRSLGLRADSRHWEPSKRMIYLWLRTLFASYHMGADRLDMAHAVEVRLPFLDHVLFDFASQIPMSLLASGGRNKFILREAARPFVSEAVYGGTKKPFLAPPAVTVPGNPLHDLIQDTLRGALPSFVNRPAIVRLLDDLPKAEPTALSSTESLLMAVASMSVLSVSYSMSDGPGA